MCACAWWGAGDPDALALLEPLKPTLETSAAAHIAPIVSALMRLGVSQRNRWF